MLVKYKAMFGGCMVKKIIKMAPYDILVVGVLLALLIYGFWGVVGIPEIVKSVIFLGVLWCIFSMHLFFSNMGKRRFKYLRLWNVFGYRKNVYVFIGNNKYPVNIGGRKESGDIIKNYHMEWEHLLEILPKGTKVRACVDDKLIKQLENKGYSLTKKKAYMTNVSDEDLMTGNERKSAESIQMYTIKFKI